MREDSHGQRSRRVGRANDGGCSTLHLVGGMLWFGSIALAVGVVALVERLHLHKSVFLFQSSDDLVSLLRRGLWVTQEHDSHIASPADEEVHGNTPTDKSDEKSKEDTPDWRN